MRQRDERRPVKGEPNRLRWPAATLVVVPGILALLVVYWGGYYRVSHGLFPPADLWLLIIIAYGGLRFPVSRLDFARQAATWTVCALVGLWLSSRATSALHVFDSHQEATYLQAYGNRSFEFLFANLVLMLFIPSPIKSQQSNRESRRKRIAMVVLAGVTSYVGRVSLSSLLNAPTLPILEGFHSLQSWLVMASCVLSGLLTFFIFIDIL